MDAIEPLRCSAKDCVKLAEFELRWNNPKIHPPERRKTWLGCGEHQETLGAFLGARGFLREVEPLTPAKPPAERDGGSG